MRLIGTLAAAAGIAALAACGSGNEAEDNTLDVNTMTVDNLTMPGDNMATDLNTMDMNGVDMNGVDMNATTDLNADANATGNTTY